MTETKIGKRRASQASAGGEQYRQRRLEIARVAAAVFREKGLDATSLGDVAQKLDTDRATLYYYFSSKQELYREVVREAAQKNVKDIQAILASDLSADIKLETAIIKLMESYDVAYPQMHVFVQEDLPKKVDDRDHWSIEVRDWAESYYQALHRIIEQGQKEGIFSDLPLGIATLGVIGAVNWAYRWYQPGGKLCASEVGAVFSQLLLKGLCR